EDAHAVNKALNAHCPQELVYCGQEIFELAEQFPGYPNDPNYIAARNHARTAARSGIDHQMASLDLDAIVVPHLTDSTGPAGCRLSKLLDAGRHSFIGTTRRHADVQHVFARTAVDRDGVRSRASVEPALAAAVPRRHYSDSERGLGQYA